MRIPPEKDIGRIAIFRALNLGDFLCSVPALRALRSKYPHAEITWIGLPRMADLARRFGHLIDAFVSFPGAPGLPEQPFKLESFVDFLERENANPFDFLIQMHGKGSVTNPLVAMLGARRLAGFYEPGEYCPDAESFIPYPDHLSEVERHLVLMRHLGVPERGRGLELPISETEQRAALQLRTRLKFSGPYICVHPGARDPRRCWAPEKFAAVADKLADQGQLIVFTGTDGEKPLIEQVRSKMRSPSVSVVGQTGLGELAAIIGQANLLVSNDTGVSHVAAATGTPSVIVFLASDPNRWAPLDKDLHHSVTRQSDGGVASVLLHAAGLLKDSDRKAAP